MNNRAIALSFLLLVLSIHHAGGQYFNRLHDVDSMYDWGVDIYERSDGDFFVIGGSQPAYLTRWDLTDMRISADGNIVLDKKVFRYPYSHIHCGDPGGAKHLSTGGYIVPTTIQTPNISYLNSATGFIKLTEAGDTVYRKVFTDTAATFDFLYTTTELLSGNVLGAGGRKPYNGAPFYSSLLVKADASGDTLWTRTYQKVSGQPAEIRTLIPLANGRIVTGGSSRYTYFVGSVPYYHYTPWFMVLDSNGTMLRDTLYGVKYGGGGALYPDVAGGYIHYGWIDTLVDPAFPDELTNFPFYIAHLDTNFRIEWLTRLPYSECNSRRGPFQIKQLRDSNFIAVGDEYCNDCLCAPGSTNGWAAKISRTGEILWNHTYWTDTAQPAYLRDVVERADGSLVFVGSAWNDTLPAWHAYRDVWIFGADSSGCMVPGCMIPTMVEQQEVVSDPVFSMYPNPTDGSFTVMAEGNGVLSLSSISGVHIADYRVQQGKQDYVLPAGLANGLYMGVYRPNDGGKAKVIRFVYQR